MQATWRTALPGNGQDDKTTLILLRHGETEWNSSGRWQGQDANTQLTERGREQARIVSKRLSAYPITAIYSSDLMRACQTAAPLAGRKGLALRVDPGLRERGFGEFEGLSFVEIEQRWPEQAAAWRRRDPDFGARGGEVLRDFRSRVVTAVTRLAMAHRGQSIALVTHGGVLDLLYREATRLARLSQPTVAFVRFRPFG